MRNSWTPKKIVASFLAVLAICALLLVGGALAVKSLLTSTAAKTMVEKAIAKAAGGDVSFGSLIIDPSGKISGSDVSISPPGGQRLTIEKFDVDIDLSKILEWKLLVRSVTITKPVVTLTPTTVTNKGEGVVEASDQKSGGAFIPPIPIEIENFKVEGLSFGQIKKDGALFLRGISLLSSLKITSSGVWLKASLTTDKTARVLISEKGREAGLLPKVKISISLNGDGSWKLKSDINLLAQTLRGFHENTPRNFAITASANGKNISDGKAVLKISANKKADINLFTSWAKKENGWKFKINPSGLTLDTGWLAGFAGIINAEGKLNVGNFSATGFYDTKTGAISATNITAEANALIAELETYDIKIPQGGKIKLKLNNLSLTPEKVEGVAMVEVFTPQLITAGFEFDGILLKADADIRNVIGDTVTGSADVTLTADSTAVGDFTVPHIRLAASANGDFTAGDFTKAKVEASIKDNATALFEGSLKNLGRDSFNITGTAHADLSRLIKIPPSDMLAPVKINSGELNLEFGAKGKAGEAWKNGDANFNITAEVSNTSGETIDKTKVIFDSASAKAKVTGALKGNLNLADIVASLDLSAKKLAVSDIVSTTPLTIHATLNSPKPENQKFAATAKVSAESINLYDAPAQKNGGSLFADISVNTEADNFKATVTGSNLDLATFKNLPSKIKNANGILSFRVSGAGKIPKSPADIKYPLPFDASASIKLADGIFTVTEPAVAISGVSLDIKASTLGNDANLKGGVWVKQLVSEELFGPTTLDPSVEIDASLENGKKLHIDWFLMDTPELGFVNSLDGYIDGIDIDKAIASGISARYVYDYLTFNLTNYFYIALDDRQKLLTKMDMQGDTSLEFSLAAEKPEDGSAKTLRIKGEAEFNHITIGRDGETIVSDLSGKTPFTKTLTFGRIKDNTSKAPAIARNKSVRETSFFESIRKTGGAQKSVTAKFVKAGPVTLNEILLDFYFKESRLGIDYFKTDILGGGLTGSFQVKRDGELYILKTAENFAGLNLRHLIKKELGLTEKESEVDGSLSIEISFEGDDNVKEIDIYGINAFLSLSRIGTKAIDRLLKFFDPKESSPAVASARTVLKFAKPSKVDIAIKRGNLSVSMDLEYAPLLGGVKVKMPIIKRAPINSLANFSAIKKQLAKLSALKTAMRAVGATHMFIDEDGAVKLQ
ncbi:hypothetical protein MNBD_NITROSPINAE01-1515 [hydrothermal vent metagenome]|uniref:Uncharacterized protein n=1 Tax=hydrothermal vent metagenome TaxID=652676 RepID=A0A3B1C0X0_9ZZZZ